MAAIFVGLALVGLARSVRRGYRSAYLVALALSGIAHILKGNHVEEAVLGVAFALWLMSQHRHFAVNPPGQGRFVRWAVAVAVLGVALAIGLGLALDTDQRLARSTIALGVGGFVLIAMVAARPARSRPPITPKRSIALGRGRQRQAHQTGADSGSFWSASSDRPHPAPSSAKPIR